MNPIIHSELSVKKYGVTRIGRESVKKIVNEVMNKKDNETNNETDYIKLIKD